MKNCPYGLTEGFKVRIPHPFTPRFVNIFPPSVFIKA